jgi:glycosyltransferase involved in cell wall biosynthesis
MLIVQVQREDRFGGAAVIVETLHRGYRAAGHRSVVAVDIKHSDDPDVVRLPVGYNTRPLVRRARLIGRRLRERGGRKAQYATLALELLAQPTRAVAIAQGREDMAFPGSWSLDTVAGKPQIVHLHNLHRNYFDLRAIPSLSASVPVVATLHDPWLLTGHCGHPLDCERWRIGCGACPHLDTYPRVLRDATHTNWQLKRALWENSALNIATPSRWLMDMVESSILRPAVRGQRVIPNGVDLETFTPGNREVARARVGLPLQATVVLFVANRGRRNPFRDWRRLESAVKSLGERNVVENMVIVCIGEDAPPERIGSIEFRFIGRIASGESLATWYQAADLCAHPAIADTFPTAVVEAMACGIPVVATDIGGIPEQVHDGVTGLLTSPGDAPALARAMDAILGDETRRAAMGTAAHEAALQRYSHKAMVAAYLEWFEELADQRGALTSAVSPPSLHRP